MNYVITSHRNPSEIFQTSTAIFKTYGTVEKLDVEALQLTGRYAFETEEEISVLINVVQSSTGSTLTLSIPNENWYHRGVLYFEEKIIPNLLKAIDGTLENEVAGKAEKKVVANEYGIAGFVFGLVFPMQKSFFDSNTMVTSEGPSISIAIFLVLAILGIFLCLMGISKNKKYQKGLAIWGLIFNVLFFFQLIWQHMITS